MYGGLRSAGGRCQRRRSSHITMLSRTGEVRSPHGNGIAFGIDLLLFYSRSRHVVGIGQPFHFDNAVIPEVGMFLETAP